MCLLPVGTSDLPATLPCVTRGEWHLALVARKRRPVQTQSLEADLLNVQVWENSSPCRTRRTTPSPLVGGSPGQTHRLLICSAVYGRLKCFQVWVIGNKVALIALASDFLVDVSAHVCWVCSNRGGFAGSRGDSFRTRLSQVSLPRQRGRVPAAPGRLEPPVFSALTRVAQCRMVTIILHFSDAYGSEQLLLCVLATCLSSL